MYACCYIQSALSNRSLISVSSSRCTWAPCRLRNEVEEEEVGVIFIILAERESTLWQSSREVAENVCGRRRNTQENARNPSHNTWNHIIIHTRTCFRVCMYVCMYVLRKYDS